MISSLLHLVDLRPRVYYTLTNFKGGGARTPWPPPLNTPMCPNYFIHGYGLEIYLSGKYLSVGCETSGKKDVYNPKHVPTSMLVYSGKY